MWAIIWNGIMLDSVISNPVAVIVGLIGAADLGLSPSVRGIYHIQRLGDGMVTIVLLQCQKPI
jgi:hypothetical protein